MSVAEKIKGIVVEQLGVSADEVKPEASFVEDLGADSLDLTELIMQAVAEAITAAIENKDNDSVLEEIRLEVEDFAREFPLFAW